MIKEINSRNTLMENPENVGNDNGMPFIEKVSQQRFAENCFSFVQIRIKS